LLCGIVKKVIEDKQPNPDGLIQIEFSSLWNDIFRQVNGEDDAEQEKGNPFNECLIPDLGTTIYRSTVTQLFEHKFGAIRKHKNDKRILLLNRNYIDALAKTYENIELHI
jgi:hypothetical protein